MPIAGHSRASVLLIAAILLTAAPSAQADVADYAGHYAGTYATEAPEVEHGTWCASIDADGTVGGSVHSDVDGRDYLVAGAVTESGGVALSAGQTGSGSSFSGAIAPDGSVSGTWQSDLAPDRFHGTFAGGRERSDAATPCGRPAA